MKFEPMKPAPPVTSRFTPASLEKTRQALPQTITPVRQSRRAGAFAPQHRARRPRRRSTELLARHPSDAAVESRLVEDRRRKLRPGAVAARGEVPDALRKVEHGTRCMGEMRRVRRAATLVVDDLHLTALRRKPQHRADEVVPVRGKQPRAPHDPPPLDLP